MFYDAQKRSEAAYAGLTAFVCATIAFSIAKLSCILSIRESELAWKQLGDELGVFSVLRWFSIDLVAGAVVGGLSAFFYLGARHYLSRRLTTALLGCALAVVALGTFIATEVYQLFGTFPTWELAFAMHSPGNFVDSWQAMFDLRTATTLVLLLLVMVAGSGWMRLWLTGKRELAMRLMQVGVALSLLALASKSCSSPSRFELDESPLLTFTESAFFDESFRDLGEVGDIDIAPLGSMEGASIPAPLDAYESLRTWLRERRPNVVLVILESTAVRHMGVTGAPVPNTPTLSRLAQRSIYWAHHYTHAPNSMMAIYQLLCGNHSEPHGPPITETRPRIDCRSLSEILVERGYRAGLFHSGRFDYSKKDRFFRGRGYEPLYDAETMPNKASHELWSWGIEEAATTRALVQWMKEVEGPKLATYIPVYPHHPYTVPSSAKTLFDESEVSDAYRNAVYYVDQSLGTMIGQLDEAGLADDTLFIFVGDHGEGFGEHHGSLTHGRVLYDEGVHSFVLWYAPGALSEPVVDRRAFGHVDLLPTLLDLMAIEQEPQHPGHSALSEERRPLVPIYTGYGHPFVGLVDFPYKFIWNRKSGRTELYDLIEDPGETRSIADEHPAAIERYKEAARSAVAGMKAWRDGLPDLVE